MWTIKAGELTVRYSGQRLVEGGRVAVVGQRDAHAPGQQPSGQGEGLLVLEQPRPEALIVDLVALQQGRAHTRRTGSITLFFAVEKTHTDGGSITKVRFLSICFMQINFKKVTLCLTASRTTVSHFIVLSLFSRLATMASCTPLQQLKTKLDMI